MHEPNSIPHLPRLARDAWGRVVYVDMETDDAREAVQTLRSLRAALLPTAPTVEVLNRLEVVGRSQRVLYEICDMGIRDGAVTRQAKSCGGPSGGGPSGGGSLRSGEGVRCRQRPDVVAAFGAWLRAVLQWDAQLGEMLNGMLGGSAGTEKGEVSCCTSTWHPLLYDSVLTTHYPLPTTHNSPHTALSCLA